jgi:hypothetical protein
MNCDMKDRRGSGGGGSGAGPMSGGAPDPGLGLRHGICAGSLSVKSLSSTREGLPSLSDCLVGSTSRAFFGAYGS